MRDTRMADMKFPDTPRDEQSPPADKRALQKIGLLFGIAALIVIGAAAVTIRLQLATPADLVEKAGISQDSIAGT